MKSIRLGILDKSLPLGRLERGSVCARLLAVPGRARQACLCALLLAVLAGCESENMPGGEIAIDARPLVFTGTIGGGSALSVGTRAVGADTIETRLKEARGRLEKKTFNATEHDIIRICNVGSDSDIPDFTLASGKRTFEYVCSRYKGYYGDIGSTDEDTYLGQNRESYSEYEFLPNDGKGFYLNQLVDNDKNQFNFYAMWRQNYDADAQTSIPTEQDTEDKFKSADVMLAFLGHSLDALQDTLRLIFYHSLSMLDVRVTLPLYKRGIEGSEGVKETPPSGYRRDDVKMYMTNIPTQFTVATTEEYNSGTRVNVVVAGDTHDAVPMFKYYVEDEDQTYLDGDDVGHTEEDDETGGRSQYRTYGFCGILAPMEWLSTSDILPLLRLELTDPTGNPERYTFTPTANSSDEGGGFSLKGGAISILEFKLSRSLKEMMLVRAKVEDWTPATAQLDLQEENK